MRRRILALALAFSGCSTLGQSCSAWTGKNFGADYVVVKRGSAYEPSLCFHLEGAVVNAEPGGIYWTDPSGHVVHVAGADYVQVARGDADAVAAAAASVGVDLARCPGGRYLRLSDRLPALRPGERP